MDLFHLGEAAKAHLPAVVRRGLRRAKIELAVATGIRLGVQCPVCRNRLRFWVVDQTDGRRETLCMRCRSLERHRRTVLFLRRQSDLYRPGRKPLRILHVAPERAIREEIRKLRDIDYVTGDLHASDVDIALDLTAIAFPDASFDVILCSHVLEHIPDDTQAMRELHRVLRPDGWALIDVPSDPSRTTSYEDAAVVSPQDRLTHFGQEDHVRVYGQADLVSRLIAAGFDVTVDPLKTSAAERRRYQLDGVVAWEHAYLCHHAAYRTTHRPSS